MMQDMWPAIQTHPLLSVLIVLIVILAALVIWLSFRLDSLLKGANGKSLEGTIRALAERTQKLETHAATTVTALNNIDGRLTRAVRGVSVKRFDPFQGAGGQQSFSTAFLNEKGDGVVISGIHARDGVRVYAKEVKQFTSERELSEDEQNAITESRAKLSVN